MEEKIDITKQLEAFNKIMDAVKDLTIEEKRRVINSVAVLCEITEKP
jgi:ligand-binding sensor protein